MSIIELIALIGLERHTFNLIKNSLHFYTCNSAFVGITQHDDFVTVGCYRAGFEPVFHHVDGKSASEIIATRADVYDCVAPF